jgi:hypothetical protein
MNPMQKPVASVLRVLGVGLILLSMVLLAFLWLAHRTEPEPWWRWMLYAFPALAGVLLCVTSSKLATRLTRDFDE